MEIGSVVSQALPAEEEETGREERKAETEGEESKGSPRVRGEVRRVGVKTKKKKHRREEAELWVACDRDTS